MRRMALITWLVLSSIAIGGAVCAATEPRITQTGIANLQPVEEFPLAAGRIVAIDRADGRVTVEHRPIPQFYLLGTTRIFHVADRTMLTGLTPGDKIRFDLQRQSGRYVITRIENSN
jgi:Cu(I)/Ag(I) efflux system protein CusF